MRQNQKGRLSVDNKGVFRAESNIYDAAFLRKYLTVESRLLFSQNASSQMFDWVLNTPLDKTLILKLIVTLTAYRT